MNDIHSILVSLLSNFFWLPIGACCTYIGFYLQVRLPNRKLWHLKDPSRLVICAANSTNTNTGVYRRPATGLGQVRAIAFATRSLYNAYRGKLDIQNILLSNEPLQERIEHDLLLLGGPKNNDVSRQFLEALQSEQPAMMKGSTIIWRTNTVKGQWVDQGASEYEGQVANRKVLLDYGLIVHSSNPFTSRNRTIVLFAGSHTYGTVAAAKFFTEDLRKHLGKITRPSRKNYVVLVSSQIVNGYPTKMKVEKSYAW